LNAFWDGFVRIFLVLALVASLVFGLAYALRPVEDFGRHLREAILAFIAFYFLLLGLRFMIGSMNDDLVLFGDLFASLALNLFLANAKKIVRW
jgi:hypothetical protein